MRCCTTFSFFFSTLSLKIKEELLAILSFVFGTRRSEELRLSAMFLSGLVHSEAGAAP